MKKFIIEFLKRGTLVAGSGPIVMAIVYLILGLSGVATEISVIKMATEILTVTLLAFIAAGISAIYTLERLSTFLAALIHGVALYVDYILFYLLNGWLKSSLLPVLIFTGIFIVGYLIIWLTVYIITKRSVRGLNDKIKRNSKKG